jgi:hypothetical protein
MNRQIRNPNDEIRNKPETGTPQTAALTVARSRSAELHSAVSQICNLRRAGTSQRVRLLQHPAEYNSAIQQIENLRYFGGGSPRHALLHLQSSGVEHKRAFIGLFTT